VKALTHAANRLAQGGWRVQLLLLILGMGLIAMSVPRMVYAAGVLNTATAHGDRAGGNEVWSMSLECPAGSTQTAVCEDAAGGFRACTSDGSCPGSTSGVCCSLVMLLYAPGFNHQGYPHPGTKGDCVSCVPSLPGSCIVQVSPSTGDGPITAVRACD